MSDFDFARNIHRRMLACLDHVSDDDVDPLELLVGQTIVQIQHDRDHLCFVVADGIKWLFYHESDCCESVEIEDICGDLDDLVGSPLLIAEARSRDATEAEVSESGTWTFYEFATIKGSVTVRWLGQSNGYYSERVTVELIGPCYHMEPYSGVRPEWLA